MFLIPRIEHFVRKAQPHLTCSSNQDSRGNVIVLYDSRVVVPVGDCRPCEAGKQKQQQRKLHTDFLDLHYLCRVRWYRYTAELDIGLK